MRKYDPFTNDYKRLITAIPTGFPIYFCTARLSSVKRVW